MRNGMGFWKSCFSDPDNQARNGALQKPACTKAAFPYFYTLIRNRVLSIPAFLHELFRRFWASGTTVNR
jgi:hypothetical protein